MNNKKCRKCNIIKELKMFSLKGINLGYKTYCKACVNLYTKEYVKTNRTRRQLTTKEYRRNNKDYLRISNIKYRENNIDKVRKWNNELRLNNIANYRYKVRLRQVMKLKATPTWANLDKIKLVYEKAKWLELITGLKYHVDHIIPLKGKTVCGLHIWENLQIISAKDNLRKSNKLIGVN